MRKRFYVLIIALMLPVLFSSCSKKEGCIDADAYNYCRNCKVDDNSCEFKGSVIFWYNQATADSLIADSIANLTYYVDDQQIGYSDIASNSWGQPPFCLQDGSVSVTLELGYNKTRISTYKVIDNNSNQLWNGDVTLNINNCTIIGLSY